MILYESKVGMFKKTEIWFAEKPYEVKDCDYIEFVGCVQGFSDSRFLKREYATLVIDLREDLNSLWNSMDRKSCRNIIKTAYKNGINVIVNQHFSAFTDICKEHFRKKGYQMRVPSEQYMRALGTLFVAELHGEILGGCFLVSDEETMRIHTIGSKRLDVNKAHARIVGQGNRLVLWEAIKFGKERGLKQFDFGGYYMGNDQNDPRFKINLFKRSFGGQLQYRYDYRSYTSVLFKIAEIGYKQLAETFPNLTNLFWR